MANCSCVQFIEFGIVTGLISHSNFPKEGLALGSAAQHLLISSFTAGGVLGLIAGRFPCFA